MRRFLFHPSSLTRPRLALDRGESGVLYAPASHFCRHPPSQCSGCEAHRLTEAFIAGDKEKLREVSGSDDQGKFQVAGQARRGASARGISPEPA